MTRAPIVVLRALDASELPRRRRTTRRAWLAAVALCGLVVLDVLAGGHAHADEPRYGPSSRGGVRAVIRDAADRHGVAAGPLIALATCESGLDPGARGDAGHSRGLVQLNDLPGTGLLWYFYAAGYTDADDPEQAADFLSRVAAGEFAGDGVTLRRWSCYWRLVG